MDKRNNRKVIKPSGRLTKATNKNQFKPSDRFTSIENAEVRKTKWLMFKDKFKPEPRVLENFKRLMDRCEKGEMQCKLSEIYKDLPRTKVTETYNAAHGILQCWGSRKNKHREVYQRAYHLIQPLISAAVMIKHYEYNMAAALIMTTFVVEFAEIVVSKILTLVNFIVWTSKTMGFVKSTTHYVTKLWDSLSSCVWGEKDEKTTAEDVKVESTRFRNKRGMGRIMNRSGKEPLRVAEAKAKVCKVVDVLDYVLWRHDELYDFFCANPECTSSEFIAACMKKESWVRDFIVDETESSPNSQGVMQGSDASGFADFIEMVTGKIPTIAEIDKYTSRFNSVSAATNNVTTWAGRIRCVLELLFGCIYEKVTGNVYYPSTFEETQKVALKIRECLSDIKRDGENTDFYATTECYVRIMNLKTWVEQCKVNLISVDGSSPWAKSVIETCNEADKVVNDYERREKSSGVRVEPVWLYLQSTPGVGKTFITDIISKTLSKHLFPEQDVRGFCYPVNSADKYWSGYKNQPMVTIDELWNDNATDAPNDLGMRLLGIVSASPMPLNMADLESKGNVHFDSKFVVTMSNHGIPAMPSTSAIHRRIWQLATVTVNENAPHVKHTSASGEVTRRLNINQVTGHIAKCDPKEVTKYLDGLWTFDCLGNKYTVSEIIKGMYAEFGRKSAVHGVKSKFVLDIDMDDVKEFEPYNYVGEPTKEVEFVKPKFGKKRRVWNKVNGDMKRGKAQGLIQVITGAAATVFGAAGFYITGSPLAVGLAVGGIITFVWGLVQTIVTYAINQYDLDTVPVEWYKADNGLAYGEFRHNDVWYYVDPYGRVWSTEEPISSMNEMTKAEGPAYVSVKFTKDLATGMMQTKFYDEDGNVVAYSKKEYRAYLRDKQRADEYERSENYDQDFYDEWEERVWGAGYGHFQGASRDQIQQIVETHAVDLIYRADGKRFTNKGLVIVGNTVLTNTHFARLCKEGELTLVLQGKTYVCPANDVRVAYDASTDIALIVFPRSLFASRKSILHHFGHRQTAYDNVRTFGLFDVVQSTGSSTVKQYKCISLTPFRSCYDGLNINLTSVCIMQGDKTVAGQCGSVYARLEGSEAVIAGIHVAEANSGHAVMVRVYKESLNELMAQAAVTTVIPPKCSFVYPEGYDKKIGNVQGGVEFEGKPLPKSHVQKQYVPSPLHGKHFEVRSDHVYVFNRLIQAPFDIRPGIDLYAYSNAKVNAAPKAFTADITDVVSAVRAVFDEIPRPPPGRLSLSEAINTTDFLGRPDLTTSPGLYWKLKGLKKRDLLWFDEEKQTIVCSREFEDHVNEILHDLSIGQVTVLAEESIKVETRDVQKDGASAGPIVVGDKSFKYYANQGYSVKQPRTVNTTDVAFNVVGRMLFGKLIGTFINNACQFFSAVGLSQNSCTVDLMFHSLMRFAKGKRICSGDIKGMEFGNRKVTCAIYDEMISRFVDVDDVVARNWLYSIMDTLYVQEGVAYYVDNRLASGNIFTTVMNTITAAVYVRYAFSKATGLHATAFRDYCQLYVYGDDMIMSVKPGLPFDNFSIATSLLDIGIVYTPPQKSDDHVAYSDLLNTTFLSRQFILDQQEGRISLALPLSKICDFMRYYKKTPKSVDEHGNKVDNFPNVIVSANFEFAQYPRDVYDQMRSQIAPTYKELVGKELPHVWGQVHCFGAFGKMQSAITPAEEPILNEERGTVDSSEQAAINVGFEDTALVNTFGDRGVGKYMANKTDPFVQAKLRTVLGRNIQIASFDWLSSSTFGANVYSARFPEVLFDSQTFQDHLKRFEMFRSSVKIEVRINTTQFNFGTLMVTWLPPTPVGEESAFYANRRRDGYEIANNDPYFISATVGNVVSFTIPWTWFYNYAYVGQEEYPGDRNAIGTLFIDVLNPLRTTQVAAATAVKVTVFAQAIEPEVAGWDAAFGSPVTGNMQSEEVREHKPKAKSGIVKREAKVAPYKANAVTGRNVGDTIVDVVATVSGNTTNILRDVLRSEGALKLIGAAMLDKPTQLQSQTSVRQNFMSDYSFVDGMDMSAKLSAEPNAMMPVDDNVIYQTTHDILSVVTRPSLVGWFEIHDDAVVDNVLYNIPCTPSLFARTPGVVGTVYLTPSYSAWYSQFFRFWRGSMRFRISIVASKFTVGRIRITYARDPETMTAYPSGDSMFSKVVDINGETNVDLVVPYLDYTPYKSTGMMCCNAGTKATNIDYSQTAGYLRISAVVPPRTPSGPGSSIYVNVFAAAGPDMVYNGLTTPTIPGAFESEFVFDSVDLDTWAEGEMQSLWETFGNCEVVSFGNIKLYPEYGYAAPERVHSLRQMVHRYDAEPLGGIIYGTKGASTWLIRPFWYWRGARRYKKIFEATDGLWSAKVNLGSPPTGVSDEYENKVFGHSSIWPIAEFEVPWYANVPFTTTRYDVVSRPATHAITPVTGSPYFSAMGDDVIFGLLRACPRLTYKIPDPPAE